jgi:hypothetical protein
MGYNSSLCNFILFLVICDFKSFFNKKIIISGFSAFYGICKLLCVLCIILVFAFCVELLG